MQCHLFAHADIVPGTGLSTVNLTAYMAESGICPRVCSLIGADLYNPCQYTVKLVEVFKPINVNYTGVS